MVIRTRHFSAAAILLLLAGVQAQHSVTLLSQSLCGVIGSTVTITCSFTTPDYPRVTHREWYRVLGSEGNPQVLSQNQRVSVRTWSSDCQLTLKNVRPSDSGVYNFRFKTKSGDWISAPFGVPLTVTDLQVKVDPNPVGQREVKLTCSATCTLSSSCFNWYRNGYQMYLTDASIVFDSTDSSNEGSYSCQVYKGSHRSPPVCMCRSVLGNKCWGVTYTREIVCALKGSSIDLPCSYNHPAGHTVVKSLWFIKQKADGEPADMREDEEYQGRVQYTQSSQNNCSLRITNLRESDAQTYRFRFHTDQSKYTGQPGVSLSVTDLEVKWPRRSKRLSCITTCALSNNPTYIWYKNGQSVSYEYEEDLYLSGSDYAGSYSCAVKGHEYRRSPAVCVFGVNSCWSVTYSSLKICSLIGSSVDIHSYYTFPDNHDVRESFWFIKQKTGGKAVDMTEDDEYQGRVQYTHSSQNNCSLRITNLRESDTQTYTFRFDTNNGDYSGEPGVSLSVTGLKITVFHWYSRTKKLNCVTSCTLSNNPIYIWYKNGQPVTNEYRNELDLYDNTDEDNYSCSIRGHEMLRSPAVYSPKNTNAVLSGETLEGGSVTLSCSSDANPPVETYSWFKREAPDIQLTTDQIYSISNLDSHHSGLYYCTAQNQLGRHDSTPVHLDVLYLPKTTAMVLSSGETVQGDSVTLSCSSDANPPVQTYSWFKKEALDTLLTTTQNYTISNINSQHSGLYYCTAHNLLGHHDSPPVHLDVLYAPRNTSLTVVPSVSDDLFTLLCSSDSNPTSSYAWYRKTQGGVTLTGNGTNLTLSSGSSSGFFYCTAENQLGSSNSSEWTHASANGVKYAATGFTVAVLLFIIPVLVFMRRRGSAASNRTEEGNTRASTIHSIPNPCTQNRSQNDSAPVYGNVSAMTPDDVQYCSVYFRHSHTQEVPLYSTAELPKDLSENEAVEYTTVSLVTPRAVQEDEIYNNLRSTE